MSLSPGASRFSGLDLAWYPGFVTVRCEKGDKLGPIPATRLRPPQAAAFAFAGGLSPDSRRNAAIDSRAAALLESGLFVIHDASDHERRDAALLELPALPTVRRDTIFQG